MSHAFHPFPLQQWKQLSTPNATDAQAALRGLTISLRAAVSSSLWLDALLFPWLYRYLCRVPDSNNKYGFPVDLI
jgi:hypothetical protein